MHFVEEWLFAVFGYPRARGWLWRVKFGVENKFGAIVEGKG